MSGKKNQLPTVRMSREHTAEIAQILGTSERQVQRWLDARLPILVADRLRARLLSQNNYGSTGSMLQTPANVTRIQRALDELIGEDLAASATVFEMLVKLDDAILELQRAITSSHLSEKRALMKGAKALSTAIRSMDSIIFIGPQLELPT